MAQRYHQRTEADGSGEKQPSMDRAGSTVLSLAAGTILNQLKREDAPRNGSGRLGEDESKVETRRPTG